MSSTIMNFPGYSIAKSVAVIGAIQYLTPMIHNLVSGVTTQYADIFTQAIITYLVFAAYSQGWISVPSSFLLGAS